MEKKPESEQSSQSKPKEDTITGKSSDHFKLIQREMPATHIVVFILLAPNKDALQWARHAFSIPTWSICVGGYHSLSLGECSSGMFKCG